MGKSARFKRLKKQAVSLENHPPAAVIPKIDERPKRPFLVFLFSIVLISGLALRLSDLNIPARSPDELIYSKYAGAVAEKGIGITKRMVEDYKSDSRAWIYPTPIRIGYIYMASAVMRTVRSTDIMVLSYISAVFSLIGLLILALLGLRFFNPWITLSALIFMAVSPMDMAIARRAWQDGVIGVFGSLLVYLCCEISANPKRKIFYPLFWALGCYSILIKESGLVIYSLCVLWLMGIAIFREKSWSKCIGLATLSSIVATLGFFIMAGVSGGPQNIIDTVRNNMGSIASNRYAVEYQSGPWYSYVQSIFMLSPAVTLLSGTGMAILAFSVFSGNPIEGIDNRRYVFAGLLFFITGFMAVAAAARHMVNLRYISVLFAPFYLMGGLGVWCVLSLLRPILKGFSFRIAAFVIAIAVVVISINEYGVFYRTFIRKGTPDLSVGLLKQNIAGNRR